MHTHTSFLHVVASMATTATTTTPISDVLDGLQARLHARMTRAGLQLECSPAQFGEWAVATLARLAAFSEDGFRMSETGGTYAEDVKLGCVTMHVTLKVIVSMGAMRMTIRHATGDIGHVISAEHVAAAASAIAEACSRQVIATRLHLTIFELDIFHDSARGP
jgi:hypothetical protein